MRGTRGLDRVLGWREEWLGFFFESYVCEGSLEKQAGRFSMKP